MIEIYGKNTKITAIERPRPVVAAPQLSHWQRNMEYTIDNALKVYERNTPSWQLNQFIKMVGRVRSQLVDPRGFSPNKVVLHVAEIPQKLFYHMVFLFGFEWRNKRDVSDAFFKRVMKFRLNQTTLPMVNPEQIYRMPEATYPKAS